jgi:hypothetical protein
MISLLFFKDQSNKLWMAILFVSYLTTIYQLEYLFYIKKYIAEREKPLFILKCSSGSSKKIP